VALLPLPAPLPGRGAGGAGGAGVCVPDRAEPGQLPAPTEKVAERGEKSK
jgi:hypothetical protein